MMPKSLAPPAMPKTDNTLQDSAAHLARQVARHWTGLRHVQAKGTRVRLAATDGENLPGLVAMRIVGGRLRGRSLVSPRTDAIRPTTDRTRESMFNILSNRIDFNGLRVIDLFAGTGALGIEALSRGAGFALFVETSTEGRGLLRSNMEALGLTGSARIFRRDATSIGEPGTMAPFDLAFADPPYGKGLGELAAAQLRHGGWLKPDSLLILEESNSAAPQILPGYETVDQRRFGDSAIGIFRPA